VLNISSQPKFAQESKLNGSGISKNSNFQKKSAIEKPSRGEKDSDRELSEVSLRSATSLKCESSVNVEQSNGKPLKQITYQSIEFLTSSEPLIKPTVTITLYKGSTAEQVSKFNTVIQKKYPHLCYELVPRTAKDQKTQRLACAIYHYDLGIQAVD
jgi:hypothetical protein